MIFVAWTPSHLLQTNNTSYAYDTQKLQMEAGETRRFYENFSRALHGCEIHRLYVHCTFYTHLDIWARINQFTFYVGRVLN